MKQIPLIILALALAAVEFSSVHAQMSSFTYQGRLNLNGNPADGEYDFMFRLLNDPTNGVAVPVIPIALAVPVTNGLFTTAMDFGVENFDGANRWLEINVRTNGSGPFTTLSPRQLLTPAPYAITAHTASNLLGDLPAGQISGTILNTSLPASPNFSGNVTANNFSGSGAGLTNLNASTLGGLNSSNFWRTTGNAGTTAGSHFVGTTDDQPLEFKVNGLRALRLEDKKYPDYFDTTPDGAPNVIGGSPYNLVDGNWVGGFIGGGGATNFGSQAYSNRIAANFAAIVGGRNNTVLSDDSTIGGGSQNTIEAGSAFAVISGGQGNTVWSNASLYNVIVGGAGNSISNTYGASTIGGGVNNAITIDGGECVIGGGHGNIIEISGNHSLIAGGAYNRLSGSASTINGGDSNEIEASWASIIAGGNGNRIGTAGFCSVVGGGGWNRVGASSEFSIIAGGSQNNIGTNTRAGTISGGEGNVIASNCGQATIAGGAGNRILQDSDASLIAGGVGNEIGTNSASSAIGGGSGNAIAAKSSEATIAGGQGNSIQGNAPDSVIGGGKGNQIGTNSTASVIGGGNENVIGANSPFGTIPGGELNTVTNWAFAAGRAAQAIHTGAFVWADSGYPYTQVELASTNANSVTMRASGGYRLFTDVNATSGAFLAAGSGSWSSMSDRNAKENFRDADAGSVLEKVVALPVQTWNYKSQDANIRHLGPMAQDFKSAFGLGESDTGISAVDADGVALAAIQGLNQKLEETRVENAELKKRLTALERLIRELALREKQL